MWSELGLRVGRHVSSVSRLHVCPAGSAGLCVHIQCGLRSLAAPREACCPRLGHIGAVGNGTCRSRNSVRDLYDYVGTRTGARDRRRARRTGRPTPSVSRRGGGRLLPFSAVVGLGHTIAHLNLRQKVYYCRSVRIRSHTKIASKVQRRSRRGGARSLSTNRRTHQQRTRPTRYYR